MYHETLDDPRGMIHIRDFLDFLAADPAFGLDRRRARARGEGAQRKFGMSTPLSQTPLLRPVLFAPPSMPALDLLARMQASRIHMALVIDEYGGTDGLVSMEDIVETIVGNIEDEHDEAEGEQIALGADGEFIVEARAPLDEVAQAVGLDLAELEEARGRRHDRRPGHGHRRPRAGARRDRRRAATGSSSRCSTPTRAG